MFCSMAQNTRIFYSSHETLAALGHLNKVILLYI